MIKKRSRPQPNCIREKSVDLEDEVIAVDEEDEKLPLADLLELRRLKKSRQGIDVTKLNKGDARKRKKRPREGDQEPEQGGLRKDTTVVAQVDDEEDDEDKEAKARKVVRQNNFTQQTNALDVDKHMMAYIEQNLKLRMKSKDNSSQPGPVDSRDDLYGIAERWRVEKKIADEGSVTNSLRMLTAIPEVDLGMDTRLKNIEETEKAKRVVAEERKDLKMTRNDDDPLAASRFYRPNLRQKSDADILRDAKLEKMGLPPSDDAPQRPYQERTQWATDEMVMERFKKRMRK